MLSDWTDEDPMHIFATLKKHSDYYNFAEPTAPEFFRDVRDAGPAARRWPSGACGTGCA